MVRHRQCTVKTVKEAWEKLYNAEDIKPRLNTKSLSNVLHTVGINWAGQNIIFNELIDLGKIDENELRERMKKAGKVLILSNLDVDRMSFGWTYS